MFVMPEGYVEVFTLTVGESLCCFATEAERDDALSDWSEREKDEAHRGRILVRYKDWEAAIKEWNDRQRELLKISKVAPKGRETAKKLREDGARPRLLDGLKHLKLDADDSEPVNDLFPLPSFPSLRAKQSQRISIVAHLARADSSNPWTVPGLCSMNETHPERRKRIST
jgi:hypothetical protein